MSGDILTVKTVKRVRSVRGSALVHITDKLNKYDITNYITSIGMVSVDKMVFD